MRTLGIDYGEKRVGVAISDEEGIIATPLCILEVKSVKDAVSQTVGMCKEREAEQIVVGLPLNMNGTVGPSAEAALAFVEALAAKVDTPIATEDERLTTKLVERVLLQGDVSRAKRKKVRDKLAAQAILQGYLDRAQFMDMEPDLDDEV
jgi:putative Holliday junction resolvase